MKNRFERLEPLDSAEREALKGRFEKMLEEAEGVFVSTGDPHVFEMRVENMRLTLSLDEELGTLNADVDTKLAVPGDAVKSWAYANHCIAFRFKVCGLYSCPEGAPRSEGFAWEPGDDIHFTVDVRPDAWEIDTLVRACLLTVMDIKLGLSQMEEEGLSALETCERNDD